MAGIGSLMMKALENYQRLGIQNQTSQIWISMGGFHVNGYSQQVWEVQRMLCYVFCILGS